MNIKQKIEYLKQTENGSFDILQGSTVFTGFVSDNPLQTNNEYEKIVRMTGQTINIFSDFGIIDFSKVRAVSVIALSSPSTFAPNFEIEINGQLVANGSVFSINSYLGVANDFVLTLPTSPTFNVSILVLTI